MLHGPRRMPDPIVLSLSETAPVVTIRPIKPGDGPALTKLFNSLSSDDVCFFHPFALDAEHAQAAAERFDDPKFVSIVAHEGEEVADTLAAFTYLEYIDDETPWDFGICIRPDMQSCGLGTQVMRYVVETARTLGIKEISLEVHQANERGVRLYQRIGFRVVEEFPQVSSALAGYKMQLSL